MSTSRSIRRRSASGVARHHALRETRPPFFRCRHRHNYVDGGNGKKAAWFPLMRDVEQLRWRFYDESTGKWTSDWPDISIKPALVELSFKLAGRNHLERCV